MPRAARLCRAEILDQAVEEFWLRGYRAASVDTLVRAIGTTRARLYTEFGDKEGLFQAVLDRYAESVVTEALRPLGDPAPALAGMDRYFREVLAAISRSQVPPGCLMTTTMAEVGTDLPEIAGRTRAHVDRVTQAFAAALDAARTRGDLAADVRDLPAVAVGLAVLAQGVWTCSRAGVDADVLMGGVAALLQPLRS